MVMGAAAAAAFFFALGYWLLARLGHFWLGILCFIIVGAALAGTAVGSGLAHKSIVAVDGLYRFGVTLVSG